MKLLLDINVVLDIVLARPPWAREAALLFAEIVRGRAEGLRRRTHRDTVFYITAKASGRQVAAQAVSDLLRIVDVVAIERADLQQALGLGIPDFEDAVQVVAGLKVGVDHLVTRDAKDSGERR
ncbi:MAG TPA: PIN domain-containing protein [Longimicrobium sp.]|nr:PIN domain-containing protein [Longimicrobium sp.]